jgi:hypothetical protein
LTPEPIEIPRWLVEQFERGYVPDPRIQAARSRYYAVWMAGGGKVTDPGPAKADHGGDDFPRAIAASLVMAGLIVQGGHRSTVDLVEQAVHLADCLGEELRRTKGGAT